MDRNSPVLLAYAPPGRGVAPIYRPAYLSLPLPPPCTSSLMTAVLPYRFTAAVEPLSDSPMFVHHCLVVPPAVAADLKARKLRRLTGTFNGRPFNLALQSRAGDDERFLLLSRQTMRDLKVRAGDAVAVICQPDESPDEVQLAEELREVFNQDEAAAARFNALTPGRRRSLAHYVSSAKGIDTRIKRALELAHKLRTNSLYGDLNPPAKS